MAQPVDTSSGPAQMYGVTITKEPGANLYTIRSENYDDLMGFMTDILSMSDGEADIEIGEEDDFDHNQDQFADAAREWEEHEAEASAARMSSSGRPFESKLSLKTLISEINHEIPEIQPGDKVDVYLPDSFMTHSAPVRVVELVDDVFNATGTSPATDDASEESIDFTGPGFVGEFDEESGETGQLVFALNQIVPGSKEKYESLMDADPYMNDANYNRDSLEHDAEPVLSDYFDDEDKPNATAWRARPFEGKQMNLKGVTTLKEALGFGHQEPDVCPMCHAVHDDTTTCDYEECGECGFDHTYEPDQAQAWHREKDPNNELYETDELDEADKPAAPASVADAVKDVSTMRKNYAAAGRYTPFSQWYKGEHGRDYAALKRAVKALVGVAKKGDASDVALAQAAKLYYDSLAEKSSRGSIYDEALIAWTAAKGSGATPPPIKETESSDNTSPGESPITHESFTDCPQCGSENTHWTEDMKLHCVDCDQDFEEDHDPNREPNENGTSGFVGFPNKPNHFGSRHENVSRLKMPIKENQGSHNFDRFMDKILVQETPKQKVLTEADSAQRVRAARHQDRPANRTKYLKG